MNIENVFARTCTRNYWEGVILRHPKKVLWIITPPQDYLLSMREILYMGLGRMKEIMALPLESKVPLLSKSGEPLKDADGKPIFKVTINTKLIGEIRQIMEKVTDRVQGSVIQRVAIDQRSKNLHVHAGSVPKSVTGKTTFGTDELNSMDDLERGLKNIEGMLKRYQLPAGPLPDKVEITVVEADEVPIDPAAE
jgi:hypothetical protein